MTTKPPTFGDRWFGPAPRHTKYGNKKVLYDGYVFDSIRECTRYKDLRLLEKAGSIRNLQLQVRYDLTVNGVHVCYYVADFVYEERDRKRGKPIGWKEVVEDAKGHKTAVYKLKKTLMRACHGIQIRES